MGRILAAAFGLLALAVASCSESKSTTCCEEACRIWEACASWSFDQCMTECRAEGDWCGSYIDCIRAKGCGQLMDCE